MPLGAPIHTILVIDDDSDILDFIELFLSTEGYHVHTATTGADGLHQATAEPLSAVLLDRRLPDMDGITVCNGLRAALGPNVPIIMVTADHDHTLAAAARTAGATAFLLKPFAPTALLDQLAQVLPN